MNLADPFLISIIVLLLCMFLSMLRILFGPTAPDRMVALDTINTMVVTAMLVFGAAYKEIIYIDVAIVYALLSFITTLYVAHYLEGSQI